MDEKLFVLAIGGTGMRCLESFVHLCAIGMFNNQTIEVMMLDTDSTNGNLGRTQILIDLYNKIKTEGHSDNPDAKGGTPNTDTFFSAKINFYKFVTDYNSSTRNTYRNISRLADGDEVTKRQNEDLSDLFLERETVQNFNLDHGYRAQTHLGSHLMYHAIIESARRLTSGSDKDRTESDYNLEKFLIKLQQAGENARVFVFGSVFGGTGASSIPIIPVAFRDAVKIRFRDQATLDLSKTKFGSTLLTQYFSFKKPDDNQLKKEGVIADSNFFPLNSQAAMQFYQGDPTVQKTYKRMYHIGWPIDASKLDDGKEKETTTGGANQKNACHVVELMCACAAYDFFTLPDKEFNTEGIQYLFRDIELQNNAFNFSARDFVGQQDADKFLNKLGAFFSFAHISLSYYEGSRGNGGDRGTKSFLAQLRELKVREYDTLQDDELEEIDNYLRMFAYEYDKDRFVPGWIYQINKSVEPGKFIFRPEAFPTQLAELSPKRLKVGEIFPDKTHWWPNGFDGYIKNFVNQGHPTDSQHVNTTKEKFLAHIYNGIVIAQQFNL